MKKILCVLVLLISLFTTGCSKQNIVFNLASYIEITETGYDGYGIVSAEIKYDKLYSDFKSKFEKEQVDIETLRQSFYIASIDNGNISNGDVVRIALQTNNAKFNIENLLKENLNLTITYSVSKLQPRIPYDAFADLKITSSGFHREGTIYPRIEHYGIDASWEWPVLVSDNNGQLSNGDIVNLKLDIDEEKVEKQYGIEIESLEYDYQVTTLISYVESSSDLKISEDNLQALNKVIEDWVISGENDENLYGRERTYQFETACLFTKENDSRICFIYHIEDGYVPSGYYVYISPNYTVLVDNENNTLITGDKRQLSTSFAKYDKDTVRYTEKWGWGQDYERQGFMYRDVPYAGKATLEDMINYLRTWYDEYPTMYTYSH